jgi:hypothetical protein
MSQNVLVVFADGCHLCEEAVKTAEALGADVRSIDVFSTEGRDIVREHRTALVPIVVVDGRLVSSGHFDREALERALCVEST